MNWLKLLKKVNQKFFYNKINPCTKTFQALRIFVNKEISELITGLINATKFLKPGGKDFNCEFSFDRG